MWYLKYLLGLIQKPHLSNGSFLRTLSNYQAHAVGMCYLSWSCMWFSFMIRTIHVSMLIRIIPNKYIFLCTNIDQWHNQTHLRLQAHFASYLIFVMRLCLLLDSWSTYPVCFWPFEWSRKMPGHRIETLFPAECPGRLVPPFDLFVGESICDLDNYQTNSYIYMAS